MTARREPMDEDEFQYLTAGYAPWMVEHLREVAQLPGSRSHAELGRKYRTVLAVSAAFDLPVAIAGAYTIWPGTLGHLSILVHLTVGLVYGSWLGHRAYWWTHL